MRVRIEEVKMRGQAWIDTVDYHVRPAVESTGEKFDAWTVEEGRIVSPELTAETVEKLRARFEDIPLVELVVVD